MDANDPTLQDELRLLASLDEPQRKQRLAELVSRDPAREQQIRSALASLLAQTLDLPASAPAPETASPASAPVPTPDAPSPASTQLGPWRLLRRLGTGAMGDVWLAEQAHPRRQVALKLIRAGVNSSEIRARFVREANLLARADHPGIARVLEAGLVDGPAGEIPYLAMEYVQGCTLGLWREQNRPDRQCCLRLLAELAEAVHAAHLKGVLHRDLKPENILVDGDGHPKILDFGVARALDDEHLVGMTQQGQLVGTLAYMSPEQLHGDAAQIDARSDVYALGAIAYELLSGQAVHALGGQSLLEALRSRERIDPRPLGELQAELRGDVSAVVMKALSRQPQQRYQSAVALAEDLRQLIAGEPVSARAPTAWESALRTLRRHALLFAGGAVIALILLGATWTSWRSATAEAQARAEAEARTEVAEAVSGFLDELLGSADPKRGKGADLSVRELLDAAVGTLDRSPPARPEVELALRELLGRAYRNLGRYDAAQRQLDSAQAIRAVRLGRQSMAYLHGEVDRAALLVDMGQIPAAIEALSDFAKRPQLPAPVAVEARSQLARAQFVAGDPAAAAQTAGQLLPELQSTPEVSAVVRWRVQQTLAIAELQLGRFEHSRELLEALIAERSAQLGEGHADVLANRSDLATALDQLGRWEEAAAILRDVHAREVILYGEGNLSPISTLQNLSKILLERGQLSEAGPMLATVATVVERELGSDHPQMLYVRNLRAAFFEDSGELSAAESEYRELLASHQRINDLQAPEALIVMNNLASLLDKLERGGEALALYAQAQQGAAATLGADHYLWGIIASNRGEALLKAGQRAAAIALLEESLAVLESSFGTEHDRVAKARDRLQQARAATQ